jgi:hypothetical protein
MNNILFDYLNNFCTTYFDDILIYLDNKLEHVEYVNKVLQHLRNASL